jgi:hypothetical protein
VTHEELAQQITEVYLEAETWHKTKLSKEESIAYHTKLLDLGNIITVCYGNILCGYVEFWRVSFEQFGRIICDEPFSAYTENVQNGQVAYLANTYIKPEYRGVNTIKVMRNRFYEANKFCTHFVGEARRKKSAPVKVYKREDIMKFNTVEV